MFIQAVAHTSRAIVRDEHAFTRSSHEPSRRNATVRAESARHKRKAPSNALRLSASSRTCWPISHAFFRKQEKLSGSGLDVVSRHICRGAEDADAATEGADSEEAEESEESEEAAEVEVEVESDEEPTFVSRLKDAGADEGIVAAFEAELERLNSRVNELENLEHELGTVKAAALRTSADFDNFRKQVDRQKETLVENSRASVLEQLIPTVDAFEEANSQIVLETEGEEKIAGSYRGLYKQMVGILRKVGLQTVATVGTNFDEKVHEEMGKVESSSVEEGFILEELRRGFMYKDRVLRTAQVKVALTQPVDKPVLESVVPQEGPGEGNRRPPEEKSRDGKEPLQGGQDHSLGETFSDAGTSVNEDLQEGSQDGIASEAPGEGKRRQPSGEEMHCSGVGCDSGKSPEPSPWDERVN